MAAPALTHTLLNGQVADASQVMTNFSDLLNGYTDGSKDLSFNALTLAGLLTANGGVILGSASNDDLTINASLASTIPIKTTNTYAIGSSTLGLSAAYFGTGSSTTCNIATTGTFAASRTYSLTDVGAAAKFVMDTYILPVFLDGSTDAIQLKVQGHSTQTSDIFVAESSAGTDYFQVRGTGDIRSQGALVSTGSVTTITNANYTVTDTDGYQTLLFSTGNTQRTLTLPTAADNAGRRLEIIKIDTGTGFVLIDGEGAETIDGDINQYIMAQYDRWVLFCNGTAWYGLESAPEYLHNTATADSSDTTSFGYGPDGVVFGSYTAERAKRVRAVSTIQKTDRLTVEYKASSGLWIPIVGDDPASGLNMLKLQNGASYGFGFRSTAVNSTDIDVFFGTYAYANADYGLAGAAWSGYTALSWRVKKHRG